MVGTTPPKADAAPLLLQIDKKRRRQISHHPSNIGITTNDNTNELSPLAILKKG